MIYYLYAGEENLLLAKRILFFGRGEVIPTPSRNSDTLRKKGLPLMLSTRLGVFCLHERLGERPASRCCERSSPLSPSCHTFPSILFFGVQMRLSRSYVRYTTGSCSLSYIMLTGHPCSFAYHFVYRCREHPASFSLELLCSLLCTVVQPDTH